MPTIKPVYIFIILALLLLGFALTSGIFEKSQEIPELPAPSVSIGCDRVIWEGTEEVLEGVVKNMDQPRFEWTQDGVGIGNTQKLSQKFDIGKHFINLNVTFNNQMLSANKSIDVINSAQGVTILEYAASKNQWGFQSLFKGKKTGVKGVIVYVDSLQPSEVNPCGAVSTKALFAGEYTWKAEYRNISIASGSFKIKEVRELKISRIEVEKSYLAGSDVKANIIIKNTGSLEITGFETKTFVLNKNYEWMGDKAKREYFNQYKANIKPGEEYAIPIKMTIPEKVSGIRPSGKYSITVDLLLQGNKIDTKIVYTEVK